VHPGQRMAQFGYALSSEEHPPNDLVANARLAEESGFEFALISDHFHPWIDRQGHSPFVWSVLGAIAHATERLEVGTGVTCPTTRTHPAIIAHAAATTAVMFEGRFFLGLGTGENLNEHIFGDPWPEYEVRAEMLTEAVELMRELWRGEQMSHRGEHYLVENARLYDVPDTSPPIMVAASGTQSAELAGEIGDGFIGTAPKRELLEAFNGAGGDGKPTYGQVTVCWGEDEAAARRLTKEIWPTAGVPGDLSTELPLPRHFEQVSELVTEEMLAEQIACGPDPEHHIAAIRPYIDAGYDNVYIHQIGPDQAGFMSFYRDRILPELA
jgi:coenzyme F420-dependent glucose-6-phosphate dehydrogenase